MSASLDIVHTWLTSGVSDDPPCEAIEVLVTGYGTLTSQLQQAEARLVSYEQRKRDDSALIETLHERAEYAEAQVSELQRIVQNEQDSNDALHRLLAHAQRELEQRDIELGQQDVEIHISHARLATLEAAVHAYATVEREQDEPVAEYAMRASALWQAVEHALSPTRGEE